MTEIKAVCSDLDGVIVESYGVTPLPGVGEFLALLEKRGLPLCVVTNQQGPMWRWITGQEKYPTIEELARRFFAIIERLPALGAAPWYISLCEDDRIINALKTHFELPIEEDYRSTEALGRLATGEARRLAEVATTGLSHVLAKGMPDVHWHVKSFPAWRKPAPGMLFAAAFDWSIRAENLAFVDDMPSGQEAARAAGCLYAASLGEMGAMLTTTRPLFLRRARRVSPQ